MSSAKLAEDLYIYLTPAGCYYAVSSADKDPARQFLLALLGKDKTPKLNIETLQDLMASDNPDKCIALLQKCQQLGWVQGMKEERKAPAGSMEDLLPKLLSKVSAEGKILIADDQGFYLACIGFPHEVAEEISALTAELAVIHERRAGVLIKNLGLHSHAWAIVNASGNSRLGFWPIFIGNTQFVIALSGIPHFKQSEFVSLIWLLNVRYARNK